MTIRFKLTLWYSGIVSCSLIFFSLIIYLFLAYNLQQQMDRDLAGRAVTVVRSIKIVEPTVFSNRQLVLPNVDVFGYPNVYLQVVDSNGLLVAKSKNLGSQSLPLGEDTLHSGNQRDSFYEWVYSGQKRIRTYNTPLIFQGQMVGLLQVGQSFSSIETALGHLKWLLFLGSIFMIFAAGSIGWWLSGKTLKPIGEIANTAALIQKEIKFTERIPHQGPDDELGNLVSILNGMLNSLEIAYSELSEAHEAQRRFVADVSHELRTPLTTIRGNIALIRRMSLNQKQGEIQEEALTDIYSEAERMSRMVKDMLVLARADAGFSIPLTPIPLLPLMEQISRQGMMLARKNNFLPYLDNLPPECQIMADADYFKQLIFILLDNAFKFTPLEGNVKLDVCCQQDAVQVIVSDSGPGIKEEEKEKIFGRFYRSDKSRSLGGTGLGLSIAFWIVQQHQGKIEVEGQMGQGSVFKVIVPRIV